MQPLWDIFCRVIDNFGDAGVCWRLATQLATRHDCRVRLWIDDLPCLHALAPAVSPALVTQTVAGVEIRLWQEAFAVDCSGDVVIEAFACDLPADYLATMAKREARPVWINLEYLTAEAWAEGCHGLASPHPALPLVKYFFFPGFGPGSGGLLMSGRSHAPLPAAAAGTALEVSLFCYEDAPVGGLLAGLEELGCAARLYVTYGKALQAVSRHLPGPGPWRRGGIEVLPLPFLDQAGYDALIERCAINFVRGEDSLVGALLAGHPFVWQAYPQDDPQARRNKVEAFLERLVEGLDPRLATVAVDTFQAWNFGDDHAFLATWREFLRLRGEFGLRTAAWSASLAQSDDLAARLVSFCHSRL
ncbi:MAG: elongation factor P maturation arginine rhamnosyltransferase EarP [Betaproteobacteria bacterium]|nr:elongation factor P maturation arginine rhamnosyltransferase EarP [Betaproteobacteria bacterium]